jgi:hypothetical protein
MTLIVYRDKTDVDVHKGTRMTLTLSVHRDENDVDRL